MAASYDTAPATDDANLGAPCAGARSRPLSAYTLARFLFGCSAAALAAEADLLGELGSLAAFEFIRRFLIHVLPPGFHRIRHYGLFANGQRRAVLARARELLDAAMPPAPETESRAIDEGDASDTAATPGHRCPCCGSRMIVIETFAAGTTPRRRASAPFLVLRIDTS